MFLEQLLKTLRYRIGDEVKPGILDAEENIRVTTPLPHGTGKSVTVLVLAQGPKEKEGQELLKSKTKILCRL